MHACWWFRIRTVTWSCTDSRGPGIVSVNVFYGFLTVESFIFDGNGYIRNDNKDKNNSCNNRKKQQQ